MNIKSSAIHKLVKEQALNLSQEAALLHKQGDDRTAAVRYLESISLLEKIGEIVSDWDNLGNCYFQLREYDKSIYCYKRSIDLIRNYNRIPFKYSFYRIVYMMDLLNHYNSEMISYATECISIAPKTAEEIFENNIINVFCSNCIAKYYFEKDFAKSIEYAYKALVYTTTDGPLGINTNRNQWLEQVAKQCYNIALIYKDGAVYDHCEKEVLKKVLQLYELAGISNPTITDIKLRIKNIGICVFRLKASHFDDIIKICDSILNN